MSPTVPVRPFGATGDSCSAVGFGCGGYWGLPAFSFRAAEALVRRAVELGIRLFDTGPSYSKGNAEARLGQILASLDTSSVFIATKVGSTWDGSRIRRDLSPRSLTASAEASLGRLRADRLDLVQLHCRTHDEVSDPAVVETLVGLRDAGICRHIGVSGDLAAADRALAVGAYDCVMVTYNVVDRRAVSVIERAQEAGTAVLVKSPLAHAVYAPAVFRPRDRRGLWYLARLLRNYRAELRAGRRYRFLDIVGGATAPQLALQYALRPAGVAAAVIGTTSISHLEEAAVAAGQVLDQRVVDRIEGTPGVT